MNTKMMNLEEWHHILAEKSKELGNCTPEYRAFEKKLVSSRIPKGTTVILKREYGSDGDYPSPNAPTWTMDLLFDLTFSGLFGGEPSGDSFEEIDGEPTFYFEFGQMSNPNGGPNWILMTVKTDDIIVTVEDDV
jgi:hypothetical protein